MTQLTFKHPCVQINLDTFLRIIPPSAPEIGYVAPTDLWPSFGRDQETSYAGLLSTSNIEEQLVKFLWLGQSTFRGTAPKAMRRLC